MPSIFFRAGRPEAPEVCPERIFPDETKNPIPFLLENFAGLENSTELAYALMGEGNYDYLLSNSGLKKHFTALHFMRLYKIYFTQKNWKKVINIGSCTLY